MAPQHFDREDEPDVSPWIRFPPHGVSSQTPAVGGTNPRALLFASAGPAYTQLLSCLEEQEERSYNGHVYEHGHWHTGQRVWDVLVFEVERDASLSVFVRTRMIRHFQPDLVFLLEDESGAETTDVLQELSGQQQTPRPVNSVAQMREALDAHDHLPGREVQPAARQSPDVCEPLEIFYSFAPPDEIWVQRLSQQLIVLRRSRQITEWGTGQQALGVSQRERLHHLQRAQIILLLVSAEYLSLNRCFMEASHAVQRCSAGQSRVIPILLRPVANLSETPFGDLVPLPGDGRAIANATDPDGLLQEVAAEISELVRRIRDRERDI